MHFSLLSYLNNLEIRKDFYSEKIEEVNKFYHKFNKNKMFRDMNKEYYYKDKVDEGKNDKDILSE